MSALYMAVTADRYELPVLVCGSVDEMARRSGKTLSAIYHQLRRNTAKTMLCGQWCRVIRVETEEERTP